MHMHALVTAGILTRLPRPPRKAVLVSQVRLGGFLCTTPALRAFQRALPNTEMVMIAPPALRDLVARSPHLDRFVAMPDLMLEQSQRPIDARGFTEFLREMQAERFDLGIQLRGYGLRSSPFFVLLGAQTNVGFAGPADMPVLDAALPFPKEGHLIDRCLELAAFLGATPSGRHTEFVLDPEDHASASALLAGARRPLIGVHPTASEPERVWRPERFAAVVARLQQSHGGTVVIVTEQKGHPAAELIAEEVRGACLNLAGMTSLPVLGAVIDRLAVFVTNDTGPAHIAYARGIPTVSLFAATTRTPFWPPESGPFRPLICDPPDCAALAEVSLDTITVDQVILAVKEVMQ
jgi:ADP-heptose:LPS heptosyltransferase